MQVKAIIDEDFSNYKLPSMFIGTCYCDWKCCKEQDVDIGICQNQSLSHQPNIEISADEIFRRYSNNLITNAVVIGGLEVMLQFDEVVELIDHFRSHGCNDDFVLYTGYYPYELYDKIPILKQYPNIVIKFGRFVLNSPHHFDKVLGIELASLNQYAERIS